MWQLLLLEKLFRDFHGGPVVKSLLSSAEGTGSIPCQGAKIPSHSQKTLNIKQKQYCNKFNKDFKNGLNQKTFKKAKTFKNYFVDP